jgi:SAM-dependent methyltransferase
VHDEVDAARVRPGRWGDYYRKVDTRGPHKTVTQAVAAFAGEPRARPRRQAVELGAGNGRDTRYLLDHGFDVVAIDAEPRAIAQMKARDDLRGVSGWQARVDTFEEASWPQADLVSASLALPFCRPTAFPAVWRKIVASIKPGGRFAGHFFGDRDDWAVMPDRTHLSRTQVLHLLKDLDVELLEEVEDPNGSTASGMTKHWHYFSVVARKPLSSDGSTARRIEGLFTTT